MENIKPEENDAICLSESDLRGIVMNAVSRLSNWVGLEDGIYEMAERRDLKRYSRQMWRILRNAYKPFGGFKTYGSPDEMSGRISLAVIAVKGRKMVACAVYRDDIGGQKLNGCGTLNGTDSQKALLRSMIRDDIENLRKYHWAEVSYPLEKWFKEMGGNPMPSSIAHRLLHKSKSKITETGDGVHYVREIGGTGETVTKAIYGFKDESTYNKVMRNLEKLCNFKSYGDFRDYANSLPRINEEIDCSENHPDSRVAAAMEVVIQIGNAWDDGIRELTPLMKRHLAKSVAALKRVKGGSQQIAGLVRNGNYYLSHMDVLECHDCASYVIMPAL